MSSLPKQWVTISFARFIACALAVGLSLACAAPAYAGRLNASALQDGKTYDRFIVRFNKNAPERSNAAARRQLFDVVGRDNGVGIGQLRRLAVGADVIQTNRKLDRRAAEQLMQRLARNPHVEYVELDAMRRPSFTPNDPSYASQWHYFEAAAGINLPAAWNKATGSGVVVAVIDSGVTPHSDLSANLVPGYDFISDAGRARDGNGRDSNPNDEGDWTVADECEPGSPAEVSSWHGTHVAGTIAAVTNNAIGVAGVAFNAKVMPLRALGKCGGSTSDIADAIVWAAGAAVPGVPANSNPAEVINLSVGGHGLCETTIQDAIDVAVAAGTVVVVAAGNNGNEVANYSPANCSNIISVAAVTRTGARASYSNNGSKIDVAAPGGNSDSTVLSTLNTGSTTQLAQSYGGYQGTSMAAAHVSGAVALMQSASVNTPAVVEAVLKSTARAFPVSCLGCGTGIVDASAAITGAISPTLIIGDVTVTEGNSGTRLATFTVTLSHPVGTVVRYDIATADGTAHAGSDYVASSLTGQSMAAGVTSKTFTVTINGDTASESTENFFVNLTNVVGVAVADGQAVGTISNDDPVPLGNDAPITGISGVIGQQFLYSLAVPAMASGLTFTTSGDSGDVDLYVKFGSPPTTTDFDCASTTPTAAETCSISPAQVGIYYILLNAYSDISGVTLTGRYALPSLSIDDVAITEGDSGTRLATFTVKLSQASTQAVTYNIATAVGTAKAGSDYVAGSLTGQTISVGQTSRTFTVPIKGDTAVEANETFLVNLGSVAGASVGDGQAIGTIINDDANAAIFWRNGSTGANMLWKSANAATSQTMTGVSNLAFKIVGIGDFDGDFKDDVLWRNSNTGENALWKSANSATPQLMTAVTNLAWKIVGVGDFDGDGKDDVVWRDSSTGANAIWKSANSATPQSMTGVTNLAWKIVGVGDFNGDGKDDVLWHNSSTGANTIWRSANPATTQSMTGVTNLAWKIVGVGDFNGDGQDDVLWRNGTTGADAIWRSANSATTQSMIGVTNLDWHIVGTGDYNGDGQADVLWRNVSTGANTIWKSANASTLQAVASVTDLNWVVCP
jgi:serine protease